MNTPPDYAAPGSEDYIMAYEEALRAWFTRDADPTMQKIDGLDIGWAGVQRWATARMPTPENGPHLDVACGYATFLAQLGWRFPEARLVGLNIDFLGPHALARPLLKQAGVTASLVRADARHMPFPDDSFGSVSCFLGLQDIEIGFGHNGVKETIGEMVRILRREGALTLLDEFPLVRFHALLSEHPLEILDQGEREIDAQWDRPVAQTAIQLYAQGRVAQQRLSPNDVESQKAAYLETLARLSTKVEDQMALQGYYVPFGPVRMVVAKKERKGSEMF